jgi:diadenosine tetraphosphate (Ap4A) HIT family hydrolase
MPGGFAIDPRILATTLPWCDWPLSTVRVMNDSRFPWLVLVPRIADAVELHALEGARRAETLRETMQAASLLADLFSGCKINIGALGNLVPQLHVHVVARRAGDAAWPGPVWGAGAAVPYGADGARHLLKRLEDAARG